MDDKELVSYVILESANGFGISARTIAGKPNETGGHLINKKSHNDVFKMSCLPGYNYDIGPVVTIESMTVPGLYIGCGDQTRQFLTYGRDKMPFKAILVDPAIHGSESHKLQMIPGPNGSKKDYFSIESVSRPGYVLNQCDGHLFFSNVPNRNDASATNGDSVKAFQADSSWKIRRPSLLRSLVWMVWK